MSYLRLVVLVLTLFVNSLRGLWELSILKNTFIVDIGKKGDGEMVRFYCPVPEETSVFWRAKGNKRNGRNLKTLVREAMDAGNFTCHLSNGDIEDYKVLLIHKYNVSLNEKILSNSKQPVECEAKNYSGHFRCSWLGTKTDVVYVFEAQRGGYTIHCENPLRREHNKYEVNCQDNESCQYGEESQYIEVVLHAVQEKRYENHTQVFMLRDITKPDPPSDLKKSGKNSNVSLNWKYPKTWCNIHSFFPLIFNVNITKENKGAPELHKDIEVPQLTLKHKGKLTFCVQARDMYYKSSWSEWTCSMHNKSRKKHKKKRPEKSPKRS
ncbi:hypothetical protein GDO86_005098 [Hymenochirus boettgeri]|uniref:Interleukin-12 subunit beta n=1 Tax=Hymenochirus boettgeri TaxID=247094 RepID=A0A8T2J641_9PIPI|nr:hypothetical protein GDO86_005098 [Hymenochirus boettgeri]